jgi:twitching motility protein PilT
VSTLQSVTPISNSTRLPVTEVLRAALEAHPKASDVFLSPGRPPQVEVNGELVPVRDARLRELTTEDTDRYTAELLGSNTGAQDSLRQSGSCDISYSVPSLARFRVNVFVQRGSRAVVMRVIPSKVPSVESLGLPPQLGDITGLLNGIVLVTGPTGAGKSSTLAALIDKINRERACHIITIEDPIEFLHSHQKSTIHQRELHSDTPSFAEALRAALRQAPHVILVGELRDRETVEIALEAAETGHLVFSTLHTIDAAKSVERVVGVFPLGDQNLVRSRLAKSFRYIVSQRLIPRKDGTGRIAAVEILRSTIRTREYIEKGESQGRSLLDAMRDGTLDGMQHFDGEIERFIRNGIIDVWTGLSFATNAGNLRLELADFIDQAQD